MPAVERPFVGTFKYDNVPADVTHVEATSLQEFNDALEAKLTGEDVLDVILSTASTGSTGIRYTALIFFRRTGGPPA